MHANVHFYDETHERGLLMPSHLFGFIQHFLESGSTSNTEFRILNCNEHKGPKSSSPHGIVATNIKAENRI